MVEIQRCRADEVVGSNHTGRAIRLKHLPDPVLQLEHPKQTEYQRLGDIVSDVFPPVLAKHSKSFSLIDCISVGVDRMRATSSHAKAGGGVAAK